MLKWTLIVVAGVVVLVGLAAVIGSMLPQGHRATKTVTMRAAPATVFSVITDFARAAEWRSGLERVEMLPNEGGAMMFREVGGQGPMTFRVEALEPPTRLVTRITDKSLPFGGTWTYELKPQGSGTLLTITEDGEVYNPLFRFMSTFIFSQSATIGAYLTSLKRKLGE
ncbi:MAG: SRPBCC family protein [Vicinamibacterales bacterium]